jgi:hypothetical protein
LGFGRSPAPLVHVVKHDIDQQIRRVIDPCALDCQSPQLFSKPIPAKELSDVNITDLQSADVLECKEGDCGIKWKLLVAFDEPCSSIWRQS